MEMLLAISIGAIVLTGCASTAITFMSLWSKEGKHDLSREKEYSVNKTLAGEIFKASFGSADNIDFSSLPGSNNLGDTYLHWRSYDKALPFISNAAKAIFIDYWLVFDKEHKELSIHYDPKLKPTTSSSAASSGIPKVNKITLLANCNGLKYLYFTPGSNNQMGKWESKEKPEEINENGTHKWLIPDSLVISVDKAHGRS